MFFVSKFCSHLYIFLLDDEKLFKLGTFPLPLPTLIALPLAARTQGRSKPWNLESFGFTYLKDQEVLHFVNEEQNAFYWQMSEKIQCWSPCFLIGITVTSVLYSIFLRPIVTGGPSLGLTNAEHGLCSKYRSYVTSQSHAFPDGMKWYTGEVKTITEVLNLSSECGKCVQKHFLVEHNYEPYPVLEFHPCPKWLKC